jgi:menaquinone-dependent protoporphyrinogen IX oxidase
MFVKLAPVKTDLTDYDLLCIGIPVWGGRPSAPVTKYLLLTKNTIGKKAICFYVYGFKESAKRCSKYVKSFLKKKGFSSIENIFIHWDDVGNEASLNQSISEAIIKVSSHKT